MEPNENLKVPSDKLKIGTRYIVKEKYDADPDHKTTLLPKPKIFIGRYNRSLPDPTNTQYSRSYKLLVFEIIEGRGHVRDATVRSNNEFYLVRELNHDIKSQIKKEAKRRKQTRKQRLNEELMEKSLARQKNLPEDVSQYLKAFISKEQKFKGGKKTRKRHND